MFLHVEDHVDELRVLLLLDARGFGLYVLFDEVNSILSQSLGPLLQSLIFLENSVFNCQALFEEIYIVKCRRRRQDMSHLSSAMAVICKTGEQVEVHEGPLDFVRDIIYHVGQEKFVVFPRQIKVQLMAGIINKLLKLLLFRKCMPFEEDLVEQLFIE